MLCSPGLFLDYNSLFPLRRIFPQNFGLGLMLILLFVNDYGVVFLKVENCCKSSRPGPIGPANSWIGEYLGEKSLVSASFSLSDWNGCIRILDVSDIYPSLLWIFPCIFNIGANQVHCVASFGKVVDTVIQMPWCPLFESHWDKALWCG